MIITKNSFFILIFFIFASTGIFAQQSSAYNPIKAFDPGFLNSPGTAYRSGSGAPGPAYWQNESDYKIEAKSLSEGNHN